MKCKIIATKGLSFKVFLKHEEEINNWLSNHLNIKIRDINQMVGVQVLSTTIFYED